MQDGPWIPWALAERIYELYALLYPGSANDQSLERLAQRGGFGWREVAFLWEDAATGNQGMRREKVREKFVEMQKRFREPL